MVEFSLIQRYENEFRFEMGFILKFGIELITLFPLSNLAYDFEVPKMHKNRCSHRRAPSN
jgi:hypothetical protein